jgi:dynein heavy chain
MRSSQLLTKCLRRPSPLLASRPYLKSLEYLTLLISYFAILVIEIANDLLSKNSINGAHDVHWIKHLRYYNEEQTTCVRMLRTTLSYGYEYLGNFTRLIITPQTERCFRFVIFVHRESRNVFALLNVFLSFNRLMSSCVEQNFFACLLGASETGKTEISKDFSKVVAKPYCVFKCCERVGYKVISTFLKVSYVT